MEKETVVFAPCTFIRSSFPGERIFVVHYEQGWESRGVAPAHYCYTRDKRLLGDKPVPGQEIEGFVPGIVVGKSEAGVPRVQLPDGDIYDIDEILLDLNLRPSL